METFQKRVRNEAVLLNLRNILDYYSKVEVKLSSNSNPKMFWKSVKGVLSFKSSFIIPPLSHNGDLQHMSVLVPCGKSKLLNELSWSLLSVRRKYFKQLQLYKIKNKLVPLYLSEGRLPTVSDVTRYNL